MMREVAIIGAGMIPVGRRDEDSLMDMLAWAGLKALDDAGLGEGKGEGLGLLPVPVPVPVHAPNAAWQPAPQCAAESPQKLC